MASTAIVVAVASNNVVTADESTVVAGMYERTVAPLPIVAAATEWRQRRGEKIKEELSSMKQIRMYSTTTVLLFYSQLNSKVGNILIKDTALRNKNAGGKLQLCDHNHVQ